MGEVQGISADDHMTVHLLFIGTFYCLKKNPVRDSNSFRCETIMNKAQEVKLRWARAAKINIYTNSLTTYVKLCNLQNKKGNSERNNIEMIVFLPTLPVCLFVCRHIPLILSPLLWTQQCPHGSIRACAAQPARYSHEVESNAYEQPSAQTWTRTKNNGFSCTSQRSLHRDRVPDRPYDLVEVSGPV